MTDALLPVADERELPTRCLPVTADRYGCVAGIARR